MAEKFFGEHLPERVELIHIIGTTSGNPSSLVTYGFRKVLPDRAPEFAVVRNTPGETLDRFQKSLSLLGPLREDNYLDAIETANIHGSTMADIAEAAGPEQNPILMDVTVPRSRTSELVIGATLHVIFVED